MRVLDNIRIVLVGTTHPGNIGATARAMKNMGLHRLYLAAPKTSPDETARSRASGAVDVLEAAVVCSTLDEAIEDCVFVAGTSARRRTIAWPELAPRAAAERLAAEAAGGEVAVLFGAERTGLSNAELDRCQCLVTIPSNPDYAALNLACAVQIVAYELLLAAPGAPSAPRGAPAATRSEMQRFYRHLEAALVDIGFLRPDHPGHALRKLVRLFDRARPSAEEVSMLRGILTAAQHPHRAAPEGGAQAQPPPASDSDR